MGIKVGNQTLQDLKLGTLDIQKVYLGIYLVWPLESEHSGDNTDDIDLNELILALACFSLGIWVDILPWKDNLPWRD